MAIYNKLPLQRFFDIFLGRILCFFLSLSLIIKRKKEIQKCSKINIIKLTGMGDAVLTLPLIKKLKEKGFIINVICGRETEPIYSGLKFVDKVIALNIEGKNVFNLIIPLSKLFFYKADYSIDTSQSSFFSTFLAYISGRRTSGFYDSRMGFFRNSLIDDSIKLDYKKHIVFNFLDLGSKLGTKYVQESVKLIPISYHRVEVKELSKQKKYICIHPCSSTENRAWPKKNFKEIISFLLKHYNWEVVLVGSKQESSEVAKLVNLFSQSERRRIIDISGKTSVKEFIALTSRFKAFIGNDGGLMHISSAMGVPTLGIFIYESPVRYAPFNKKSSFVYGGEINEDNQYSWRVKYNPSHLKSIKTKQVIDKLESLIR